MDFHNVLIRPRSTISSRSQVDLTHEFTFRNAKDVSWTGVPIIASNGC